MEQFIEETHPGGYRKLEIYHLAHDLAVRLHAFSLLLPKFEQYEIGSQLRRAAESVSANIVEGYGRRQYRAEFIRFLIFAQASCDETTEWLTYIKDCHSEFSDTVSPFLTQVDELGRKLNRFIQAVSSGHRSPK